MERIKYMSLLVFGLCLALSSSQIIAKGKDTESGSDKSDKPAVAKKEKAKEEVSVPEKKKPAREGAEGEKPAPKEKLEKKKEGKEVPDKVQGDKGREKEFVEKPVKKEGEFAEKPAPRLLAKDMPRPPLIREGDKPPVFDPNYAKLRIAIDNLRAAGRHDLADKLEREIEPKRPIVPQPPGIKPQPQPPIIAAQKEEIERLRAEVGELSRLVRQLQEQVNELMRQRR